MFCTAEMHADDWPELYVTRPAFTASWISEQPGWVTKKLASQFATVPLSHWLAKVASAWKYEMQKLAAGPLVPPPEPPPLPPAEPPPDPPPLPPAVPPPEPP